MAFPEAGIIFYADQELPLGLGGCPLRRILSVFLLRFVLVLSVVSCLNFVLFRLMPGDPVSTVLDPRMSPEAKEELRRLMGLDEPLTVQLGLYLVNSLRLEFGSSFYSQRPVVEEISRRLPLTVGVMGSVLVLSLSLGLLLGLLAHRFGGPFDLLVSLFSVLSSSLPSFFLQLGLLYLFSYRLALLPTSGITSVPPPEGLELVLDVLRHLLLPVGSLVLVGFGGWALYVREMASSIREEHFVKMAESRGLPPSYVGRAYVLRNLLPPLATMVLMSIPGVVGGAVITETVFSLDGLGKLLVDSVLRHDYPVAQGAFFLLASLTVLFNLLSDLLQARLDPRVRGR